MALKTANVQFSSNLNYDQVIYATSRTLNLTENAALTTINSGINQYGLPLGIFSIDGGVTWNDIGEPYGLSLNVNKISLTVNVRSTGNINLWLSNPAGGSTSYSTMIKLVLLATDSPSELPTSVVPTTNATSYLFGSNNNYRYIQKTHSQLLTNTTQYTFAHGQNAIPIVQPWALVGSNFYTLYGISVDSRWNTSIPMEYYIIAYDTTNIYFGANNNFNSTTTYLRTYQQ